MTRRRAHTTPSGHERDHEDPEHDHARPPGWSSNHSRNDRHTSNGPPATAPATCASDSRRTAAPARAGARPSPLVGTGVPNCTVHQIHHGATTTAPAIAPGTRSFRGPRQSWSAPSSRTSNATSTRRAPRARRRPRRRPHGGCCRVVGPDPRRDQRDRAEDGERRLEPAERHRHRDRGHRPERSRGRRRRPAGEAVGHPREQDDGERCRRRRAARGRCAARGRGCR